MLTFQQRLAKMESTIGSYKDAQEELEIAQEELQGELDALQDLKDDLQDMIDHPEDYFSGTSGDAQLVARIQEWKDSIIKQQSDIKIFEKAAKIAQRKLNKIQEKLEALGV